ILSRMLAIVAAIALTALLVLAPFWVVNHVGPAALLWYEGLSAAMQSKVDFALRWCAPAIIAVCGLVLLALMARRALAAKRGDEHRPL
ncbi:hypothetical protein, partial [Undibacterium luofuense]